MDNKDKDRTGNDDLLMIELDDRLEFSGLPVEVMDLQTSCINGDHCMAHDASGCTNLHSCHPPVNPPES